MKNSVFYGEETLEAFDTTGITDPREAGSDSHGNIDQTQAWAAKWLNERVNRVPQNPRCKRALRAITDCLSEPSPTIDFLDFPITLAALACLSLGQNRSRRKAWETLWAFGTGKTWKSLTDFPQRLRSIAKEVEQVNASQLFVSVVFSDAKTPKAEVARKRLTQLPGLMRLYGAALDTYIARVPQLTAARFPPSPQRHSQWLFNLSYAVKLATGQWHDREVAELLEAAAIVLNVKSKFDASTLAKARSRLWKKKT
jgi:hypothetical protein